MEQIDLTPLFTPGEILAPGSVLRVAARAPIDARSAGGSVRVYGSGVHHRREVGLAEKGTTVEITTDGLADGSYLLVVDELLADRGGRFASLAVPFALSASARFVGPDLRIEHSTAIDDGAIVALKAVDRSSGEPATLAFDGTGERIDLDALLEERARQRFERLGALDDTLDAHLRPLADGEPVDVIVWPALPKRPHFAKPERGEIDGPPPEEREYEARAHELALRASALVSERGGEVRDEPVPGLPIVSATLPVSAVRELARADGIGAIFLDDRSEIPDLGTSISIARTDQAHSAGFDGSGVKVAVFESGPKDTTDLTFVDRYTSSPSVSDHARLTSAVIKNNEPNQPHGHAPGCDLYSANSGSNDALRWAAEKGCTVISQSFHRNSEPKNGGLQADDLLKDWLALRWPYPTIVQAAGNFWQGDDDNVQPPSSEFVNHKGFNTLSVGNHDDTATAMSSDSVFRNPTSSHGDRELPEIAANGVGVTAVGLTMSGTSFAAPATAGVAAVTQQVDPTLKSWPEGCRAILLATAARNVAGGTWWADVQSGQDGSDGAGAVDAAAAVRVARSRRTRNNVATQRGWDIGTLSSDDFGRDRMSTFRYRVRVPNRLLGARVKVALAWDSDVWSFFGIPLGSSLDVDFDLIVSDAGGNQVANSSSWDNSYEIAEFFATPGATYDILVRRWSGTDSVWFGIAWDVTGFNIRLPIHDWTTTRIEG